MTTWMRRFFILMILAGLLSADTQAYAASGQKGNAENTDIIDESRAQREKLRESINNARAVLDSSSGSGSGEDSTEIIRHTNGAAPSNYRPHGQLYTRTYDASKVYNSSYSAPDTTTNEDYIVTQNATPNISAMDTVGNMTQTAPATAQPVQTPGADTAAQTASTQISPAQTSPVSSSAPIRESSNPAMTEKVKAIYNLVPEPIRSDYENNGWEIRIVPQDTIRSQDMIMSQVPKILGILAGLTDTGQKTIFLDDEYADDAMAHEMGHYVDMILLGSDDWPPSYSDEFRNIYEQEKDGFNSSYPKSSPHEYFAETFALYIECAGSLQQDFPRTYEYMDRLISPYGGTTTRGKILTQKEKDDRYGINFAELFDFDSEYKGYINDLKEMISKGINSPAAKRGADAVKKGGAGFWDTLISGIKEVQKAAK